MIPVSSLRTDAYRLKTDILKIPKNILKLCISNSSAIQKQLGNLLIAPVGWQRGVNIVYAFAVCLCYQNEQPQTSKNSEGGKSI